MVRARLAAGGSYSSRARVRQGAVGVTDDGDRGVRVEGEHVAPIRELGRWDGLGIFAKRAGEVAGRGAGSRAAASRRLREHGAKKVTHFA